MKAAVTLTALLGAVSATNHLPKTWADYKTLSSSSMESLFDNFKVSFGRRYLNAADEEKHFAVFKENVKTIFDFNDQKGNSYVKGISKFTDMSTEERQSFIMPESTAAAVRSTKKHSDGAREIQSKPVVNSGNWNMNGQTCDLRPFTTSVKDQGSCGSCWSFGTGAAAEASHFLWSLTDPQGNYNGVVDNTADHYKDATQVAEQALMECCTTGSNGCGGGGTFQPMECAVRMGGVPSVLSHPYLADNNNFTCAVTKSQASVVVDSWYKPCDLDEACLKTYIGGDSCSSFSTLAMKTSIEVISSFYDYAGGVYSDPTCPDDKHNHAVAIVGWGTDATSGKDYWIVRNSWGPDWGVGGYINIERGSNMCCIACDNFFFQ